MNISFDTLKQEFRRVLLGLSFEPSVAGLCATIFAENSRDGVHSHGLNRFPSFVSLVKEGLVDPHAHPEMLNSMGAIESWDGHSGPGMYNATLCMNRAMEIAGTHGLGCVVIRNTNHWMRGGTYGWQAADAGYIGICFTNTIANVTPWGGLEPRLGNNPLVIAVPRREGHVVLDMAMSQYSFGKLHEFKFKKQQLPVLGGYDSDGKLSTDPQRIIETMRGLPIGFWKGSGLSLMLDLLLTALSGGSSVSAITKRGKESDVSQCFIAIKNPGMEESLIEEIIRYTKTDAAGNQDDQVLYPGENALAKRKRHVREGIPVNEKIWGEVISM